jgi:hypothetical protein
MEGWRSRFHFFPLFAVVVALFYYGPFLDNFFTFDDFKYMENMYRSRLDVMIGYGSLRIISNLSWWPLFALSGTNPFAYNLFALIVFTANGILLYFLLLRLFADRTISFLAAAFFITSSVGADAVLWKATNSSLISLFFYLSTLLCYTKYRQTQLRKYYFQSIALYAFAIFSKEEAASLPFIAALIDIVFFGGWLDKRGLLRRIAPFCALIIFYLAANAVVFNYLLGKRADPQTLFSLRPLYSLLGGSCAFFLAPDGFIRINSKPVYLTALFIALSFLLGGNRRLLLFGYLWIFFAFLPQSLTGLGQFEPRVMVNSISRYLYITSIGTGIVLAVVLHRLRDLVPVRVWYAIAGCVLVLFVWLHYPRVSERGEQWQSDGEVVKEFIVAMKRNMAQFPSPSYIFIEHRPTGTAFVQQALRAFYGNPQIYLVSKSSEVPADSHAALFSVDCWQAPQVQVQITPLR